jgi:hypothetical protein
MLTMSVVPQETSFAVQNFGTLTIMPHDLVPAFGNRHAMNIAVTASEQDWRGAIQAPKSESGKELPYWLARRDLSSLCQAHRDAWRVPRGTAVFQPK